MSGCHHSPASVVILNVQSEAASISPREGSTKETEEEISPPGDHSDSKAKARKWRGNGILIVQIKCGGAREQ